MPLGSNAATGIVRFGFLVLAVLGLVEGPSGAWAEPGRWHYDNNGTAQWDMPDGSASAFVFKDLEFNEYAFGFERRSSDEVIHLMGISVELGSGQDIDLPAHDCYGNACIYPGEEGVGNLVSIPIPYDQKDAILEVLKAGKTLEFRFQTQKSFEQDKFYRLTFGLENSRRAIEELERDGETGSD